MESRIVPPSSCGDDMSVKVEIPARPNFIVSGKTLRFTEQKQDLCLEICICITCNDV